MPHENEAIPLIKKLVEAMRAVLRNDRFDAERCVAEAHQMLAGSCPACNYRGVGRNVVFVKTVHGCQHGAVVTH